MDTRPRPYSFPSSPSNKTPLFHAPGEFFASWWEEGSENSDKSTLGSLLPGEPPIGSVDQSGGPSSHSQGYKKKLMLPDPWLHVNPCSCLPSCLSGLLLQRGGKYHSLVLSRRVSPRQSRRRPEVSFYLKKHSLVSHKQKSPCRPRSSEEKDFLWTLPLSLPMFQL